MYHWGTVDVHCTVCNFVFYIYQTVYRVSVKQEGCLTFSIYWGVQHGAKEQSLQCKY